MKPTKHKFRIAIYEDQKDDNNNNNKAQIKHYDTKIYKIPLFTLCWLSTVAHGA